MQERTRVYMCVWDREEEGPMNGWREWSGQYLLVQPTWPSYANEKSERVRSHTVNSPLWFANENGSRGQALVGGTHG